MNKSAKGNYYKRRTKDWYEKQGYVVEGIEKSYKIYDKKNDKIIFVKRDLWGGDLVACKKCSKKTTIFSDYHTNINATQDEMIWIQVKSNKVDINKGLKELEKSPLPSFVKKIVVYWPERAREPEIYECE